MISAVTNPPTGQVSPALAAIAAGLPESDTARLAHACEFAATVYAGKLLGTGEPALEHAMGVARNVAALRMDAETRIAGILFSAPQYLADSEAKLGAEFGPTVAALRWAGYEVAEVDSGCCGMAGSFGFEREHYDVSVTLGNRRLAPAVKAATADTEIVAPGVSCRQQIEHLAGRQAKHPAQILREALRS